MIVLYRPMGLQEMLLVQASGWKHWPPRLPEQPLFYPVLQLSYAQKIARDWNTKDINSGYVGIVTQFGVPDDTTRKYPVHSAGGREHAELWVPAEELEEFNSSLQTLIEVVEVYYGPEFKGEIDRATALPRPLRESR